MSKKECYFCGAAKTSKEHVPPKCLFPEQKDTNGIDYRTNLLTVPSCDLHNSETSCDDEFLLACLCPLVGNNLAAFVQNNTKLQRAMIHTNGHLQKITMQDLEIHIGQDNEGNKTHFFVGRANHERLKRCFDKIARGIWYIENNRTPFQGQVRSLCNFLFTSEPITAESGTVRIASKFEYIKNLVTTIYKNEFSNVPFSGSNPDIFKYQIGTPDENQIVPIVLTFYGNALVMCAMQAAAAPPLSGDLESLLTKTRIDVDLGEEKPLTIKWDEKS